MDSGQMLEHHVSLQGFIDEIPVCTQLMFDIDDEHSIQNAKAITRVIERKLNRFNIQYDTYFSGNKGFHVVTKSIIMGEDSHLVCAEIQKKFFNFDCVDSQIYRNKGTIRAVGSINYKTGLFKTKIDTRWTVKRIKEESSYLRKLTAEFSYNNTHADILTRQVFVPDRIEVEAGSYEYIETPCITAMMNDTNPPRALWHKIIYTLAKTCLGRGDTVDEAIAMFDKGFFASNGASGYSRASYIKVVRSVYRSGLTMIGCKKGLSADAMKAYCVHECIFNSAFDAGKALEGL